MSTGGAGSELRAQTPPCYRAGCYLCSRQLPGGKGEKEAAFLQRAVPKHVPASTGHITRPGCLPSALGSGTGARPLPPPRAQAGAPGSPRQDRGLRGSPSACRSRLPLQTQPKCSHYGHWPGPAVPQSPWPESAHPHALRPPAHGQGRLCNYSPLFIVISWSFSFNEPSLSFLPIIITQLPILEVFCNSISGHTFYPPF